MKYRVIEVNEKYGIYQPQYLSDADGWKVPYSDGYQTTTYDSIEKAKEACISHAQSQPRVVWSDDL